MEELAYDTLSEAKELEAAGFSGSQAHAIVGTVSRSMEISERIARDLGAIKARIDNELVTRSDLENFATKADLKNFATKDDVKNFVTKEALADFRTEMVEGFGALRAELKDSIAGVYRTVIWVMAGTYGGFAAIVAAMRIWG